MKQERKKNLAAVLIGMAVLGILYLAEGGFDDAEETAAVFTLAESAGEETDSEQNVPAAVPVGEELTGTDIQEEVTDPPTTDSTADENDGRININTADAEELKMLSGIGDVRAAAIIAYRETHGSFKSTEEIMNVSGIGEGIYGKIRDKIRI